MIKFDSNPFQVVTVKLAATKTIVSDGGGVVSGNATCDPSGGSGSTWTSNEYSYFAASYALVRCVGIYARFTGNLPNDGKETSTTGIDPIVISGNLVSQSTPSTYLTILDNFRTTTWNAASDASKSGLTFGFAHNLSALAWLPTSNPSNVTGTYAGCPGGIGWYGTGFPVSLTFGQVTISGIYQFASKS